MPFSQLTDQTIGPIATAPKKPNQRIQNQSGIGFSFLIPPSYHV